MDNIKPTDKVCYNCKYLAWAIGIGAGLRCCVDPKKSVQIPTSAHSCDKFSVKDKLKQ